MIEIARVMTFGTINRRDIIRRLMGCCEAFKNMTFATAAETYRYYERNGLVRHGDNYLIIYHNCEN
jgi:UDP-2,3-diacylglucosamine pyrophosphatase LpxH